jgi:hypothetical protein
LGYFMTNETGRNRLTGYQWAGRGIVTLGALVAIAVGAKDATNVVAAIRVDHEAKVNEVRLNVASQLNVPRAIHEYSAAAIRERHEASFDWRTVELTATGIGEGILLSGAGAFVLGSERKRQTQQLPQEVSQYNVL